MNSSEDAANVRPHSGHVFAPPGVKNWSELSSGRSHVKAPVGYLLHAHASNLIADFGSLEGAWSLNSPSPTGPTDTKKREGKVPSRAVSRAFVLV